MRNKLITFIILSLFSFVYTATAQKLINSPYSRFNLGTLQPQGSFKSLSMGGVSTAMRDNTSIFFLNPASYSSLDTISFVFDFGLDYGKNYISGTSSKFSSDDINFHHLIMGLPISKGWGFAVGIIPFSSGYYNITGEVTTTSPDYNPNVGEYKIVHSGTGGISKIFLGTGVRILRNLSLGANLTILTGQIDRANQFVFSSSTDFYSTFHNDSQEHLELKGLGFDYGLQYTIPLKKNYFINLGVSLSSNSNYNTKYNQLSMKYTAYGVSDTVSYTSNNSAKTYIPGTLRAGISFGKQNKFSTALDFVTTKWSAARIPGTSGYAADTKSLLFGAEFIPDKFSNYSYLSRVQYRIGGHIGDNYLIINGEQLKEYGASVGLGVPLPRTQSVANIYFDFTRRTGSLSNTMHREDYISVGFSLNLYDNWFLKRKYD
jgi:hypothetical protein